MKDLVINIVLMLILIGLLIVFGCQSQQKDDNGPPPSGPEVLYRTVVKTNWLATAAIIGIGASVFVGWTNLKLGLAGVTSCFFVLAITLATARFAIWIAIGGIIVPVILLVYTIFIKNKAIKEIVQGGEWFKNGISMSNYDTVNSKSVPGYFNDAQKSTQSPSTQKIVDKVKEKT